MGFEKPKRHIWMLVFPSFSKNSCLFQAIRSLLGCNLYIIVFHVHVNMKIWCSLLYIISLGLHQDLLPCSSLSCSNHCSFMIAGFFQFPVCLTVSVIIVKSASIRQDKYYAAMLSRFFPRTSVYLMPLSLCWGWTFYIFMFPIQIALEQNHILEDDQIWGAIDPP